MILDESYDYRSLFVNVYMRCPTNEIDEGMVNPRRPGEPGTARRAPATLSTDDILQVCYVMTDDTTPDTHARVT
jgi:hypothetical protein